MAQTHALISTRISALLQDASGAIFSQTASTGEIALAIKDCLREIAVYVPHIVRVIFYIESREGTATSTSTSHLVDATNAQFLSTDVGKVVYNSTDNTYAVITVYTSTSDVTLSKNIMASGEAYEIYNEGCFEKNQINISDVVDYIDIRDGDRVEYPIGTSRNIEVDGDILTLNLDTSAIDDSSETGSDVEVHVYFRKRHKLSAITASTWAVNNADGYDTGDTSMAIDATSATGTIEEGQEFTIAYRKETYTVTANTTIATNAATISFYPGLEADVANNDVITFKLSSLTPMIEPPFCKFVAGTCAMSKSSQPIQETINAIAVLSTASTAIGNMSARITQAFNVDLVAGNTATGLIKTIITDARTEINKVTGAAGDLVNARTAAGLIKTIITNARTEIDKVTIITPTSGDLLNARTAIGLIPALLTGGDSVNAKIVLANAEILKVTNTSDGYLKTGKALFGTTDVYGAIDDNYKYSMADLSAASDFLGTATGLLNQAQANAQKANTDINLASAELSAARTLFDQAISDAREVSAWGEIAVRELSATEALFNQAQLNAREVNTWTTLATGELSSASQYLNQGIGYLRKISSGLSVAGAWQHYYAWGKQMKDEAIRELQSMAIPRKNKNYART